jgi:hypothetical protein
MRGEKEQNDNERILFNAFLHAIFNYTKGNKLMLTCVRNLFFTVYILFIGSYNLVWKIRALVRDT